MKSTMLVLLLSLLVGCGGGSNFQPQQAAPLHPVVFFGDSIVGEWDLDKYFPAGGYVNGGMFGYRTEELKAILPDVLSGKNICHGLAGNDTFPLSCVTGLSTPKTIVIMAGWNNLFAGDPSNALADLQSMAAMANAKGVKVIVGTLYPYDPAHPTPWMKPLGNAPVTFYDMWRDPLNAGIGTSIPNVTIVDFSSLLRGQSDYTQDGIHPNDEAYAQMAARLSGMIN
jgi:lysophospholipase L1-like esterase